MLPSAMPCITIYTLYPVIEQYHVISSLGHHWRELWPWFGYVPPHREAGRQGEPGSCLLDDRS